MEKGRFADWPEEGGSSEASKTELSDTKKKKSRKGSDSSRPETTPEPKVEKPKRPEPEKVSRALTDFIVERDAGGQERTDHEKVKEKPEEAKPVRAEKPAAEHEKFVEAHAVERTVGPPESEVMKHVGREDIDDDDDEAEEDQPEQREAEHAELPEHEHAPDTQAWPEQIMPLELEPNQLNGGEVILWKHDGEPRTEQPAHVEAQPEAVSESEVPVQELTPQAVEGQEPQQGQYEPHYNLEAAPAEVPLAVGSGEGEPPAGYPEAGPAAEENEPPAGDESPMVPLTSARRLDPAEAYRQYMAREAADQTTADSAYAEPMVTKRAAEDDAYYAARRAQSRGFVSGLLVAGLWARHRGKKLRRQFDKQFKKQDKELQQAREDQRFYAAEQTKKQDESNRQLSAMRTQLAGTERQSRQQERTGRQTEQALVQQEQVAGRAEQALVQQERINREAARAPQGQETNPGERLEIPPEHRLETSAWHTIEVDARTGKPVEQPTFAYGQEYYRERAHEVAALDKRSTVAAEVAIAGAAAVDSQVGAGVTDTQESTPLPSRTIPSASTQGTPRAKAQAKLQSAKDSLTKPTAAGPIWPFVIALVAIFIALVFLI